MIDYIVARNVINDEEYTIPMGSPSHEGFETGALIFGSTLPWNGKWYWSGSQRPLGKRHSSIDLESLRTTFFGEYPLISYRYCPDREEIARKIAARNHEDFIDFYGAEMKAFDDGLAMAASEKKRAKRSWKNASQKEIKKTMKKHGLDRPEPDLDYPKELLEAEDGVVVFSDPIEGITVFQNYNKIIATLQAKRGELANADPEFLWWILSCPNTPPSFVRCLVKQYGVTAFYELLKLNDHPQDLVIEYILRAFKGEYFRKRYPDIEFM